MNRIEQKLQRSNKPGLRPSHTFFRRMGREHPKLRIAWSSDVGEWLVLQRGIVSKDWQVLMALGRIPKELQVLRRLSESRMGRMNPEKARKFLLRMDTANDAIQQAAVRASAARMEEGGDRMFSALGLGTMVSMYGTGK